MSVRGDWEQQSRGCRGAGGRLQDEAQGRSCSSLQVTPARGEGACLRPGRAPLPEPLGPRGRDPPGLLVAHPSPHAGRLSEPGPSVLPQATRRKGCLKLWRGCTGPGATLSCPGTALLDQLKKTFLHRVRGKYPGQLEIGSPFPPHDPWETLCGAPRVWSITTTGLPFAPSVPASAADARVASKGGVAHLTTKHLLFPGGGGRSQ